MDEKFLADFHKKMEHRKKIESQIFYFDEKGNATDKDHAVKAIIREIDEFGQLINETVGTISSEAMEEDEEYRRKK